MTWRLEPLRALGTWSGGGTPSKATPSYWLEGSIPWLSPKDMGPETLANTQDKITPAAVAGSAVKLIPGGSVAVVVRSGILERRLPVAVVPFATTLNQDMKALTLRPGLDARWVAWGLRRYEHELLRDTRKAGTTVASIEMPRFLDFEIPIPDEAGQRRTLEILEDHLARLDAADRDLGAARARIDLAVGMHAEWLARQAGGLQRTVADVADFVTDGDHNPPKRVAQGVPHVTARGITSDGRIDLTSATYVTEEGYAQTSLRYRPSPGDVIVTCVGTIGRIAIVPKGVRFSADRNLAAIRPDPSQVTSEYLRIWLTSPKRQHQMRSASGSTAQPHLYLRDLRALPIDVPSLDVQESMAGQESEYGERVRRQDAAVAVTARRSTHLRRAVLAAAFEGKLTGRHTDDEVIEEMAAAR